MQKQLYEIYRNSEQWETIAKIVYELADCAPTEEMQSSYQQEEMSAYLNIARRYFALADWVYARDAYDIAAKLAHALGERNECLKFQEIVALIDKKLKQVKTVSNAKRKTTATIPTPPNKRHCLSSYRSKVVNGARNIAGEQDKKETRGRPECIRNTL